VITVVGPAPTLIEYHRDDVAQAAKPYVLGADLAAVDAY